MDILFTLLPLALVAANYLIVDIRDRRQPEHDTVCG